MSEKPVGTHAATLLLLTDLLPMIAAQAAQADQSGSVDAEVIAALKRSDIMRYSASENIGGLNRSIVHTSLELEAVAGCCTSTAWVLWNHLCTFHLFAGLLGPGQQDWLRQLVSTHQWVCFPAGASTAIRDVDVVVFVVDKDKWNETDNWILEQVKRSSRPVILAVNKVDQLDDKAALLPFLEMVEKKMDFDAIIPVSALRGKNLDALDDCINQRLPKDDWFFDEDQVTDRSSRFMAAELVREKIMRQLGAEVPYEVTVEIEEFSDSGKSLHIGALILVEREGQKRIIIGNKGSRLRMIGQDAREDMEEMFERKVMLKLWVKVKSGWSDDERALRSLGYNDFD